MNCDKIWLNSIECCMFAKKSGATFNENYKSSVWRFACGKSKIHPTQKPLNLFEYIISVSSNEGDVVFDPFMGSGTTAVAAINKKRKWIGFELNTEYFNVAVERIKKEGQESEKQMELF